MKKVALLAAVVGMFSMTSCKKDYTCECSGDSEYTSNVEIKKAKKKDAEATCDAAETSYKMIDDAASCSLKYF